MFFFYVFSAEFEEIEGNKCLCMGNTTSTHIHTPPAPPKIKIYLQMGKNTLLNCQEIPL